MMRRGKYSGLYRELEKIPVDSVYLVTFKDGSQRKMKAIELSMYSLDVTAGIVELGERGQKKPVVKYERIWGKDDLSPFMKDMIEDGIEAGKEVTEWVM